MCGDEAGIRRAARGSLRGLPAAATAVATGVRNEAAGFVCPGGVIGAWHVAEVPSALNTVMDTYA